MSLASPPQSPQENRVFRTSDQLERTPVGDRDKLPKIQLCIELRKKEVKKKRSSKSKKELELVLEVSVMYLKNLPRRQVAGKLNTSTFVKIQLIPGSTIYSTELKMDKQNQEKVDLDFIEVFGFPLESEEDLQGKVIEVQVCDKKMTRNATIFGETKIEAEIFTLGKPVCKWFNLDSNNNENEKTEA